ncbi:MAG: class I SAM-dependent methyltransferase [Propionibacteriaceae bacterium]|nr:class I SAM-dependent methyltransferase [Propionibacteriaceae bacterium]
MTHYFDTPDTPGRHWDIQVNIWGHELQLHSSSGVFSSEKLDPGTAVLFRLVEPPKDAAIRILDLGCGIGPIALGLGLSCPSATIDAVDVNRRALELTRLNAERHHVGHRIVAVHPEEVNPEQTYDQIWSNPPVRIGKDELHKLLLTWLHRLKVDGEAIVVMGKNLGADSLHRWLESQGFPVTRVGSAKGYRVFRIGALPS